LTHFNSQASKQQGRTCTVEHRLTVGDEDSLTGSSRNGRSSSLQLVEGAAEPAFGAEAS